MELVEYNKTYKEFKAELDAEMSRAANSFVRIGYALKVARDTNILYESGYTSVVAFAAAEYNLDKTQVSRFIAINDKFSEGGYSNKIQEQYAGFGYAKLSMMLNMPDEVNELLTADLSKTDIKAIKDEIAEEQKTSDIEMVIEQQEHLQEHPEQQEENMLTKAVKSRLQVNPEMYAELHRVISQPHSVHDVAEIFCPGESKVDMVRIPGIGRLMVSYKGPDKNIDVVAVRTGEKETYTWADMENLLLSIMPGDDVAAAWQQAYGEPYPEKQKIAPVQPEKKQEKPKSKVTKAAPKKPLLHDVEPSIPEPDPVEPPKEDEKEPVEEEKQIEGQDSIEKHKDWMPEPVIDTTYEDVTENTEIAQDGTKNVQNEAENVQNESETAHIEKKVILDKLYVLRQKVLNDNKVDAEVLAEEILKKIGGWQP